VMKGFDLVGEVARAVIQRGYTNTAPGAIVPVIIQSFEAWSLREFRRLVGNPIPLLALVQKPRPGMPTTSKSDYYGTMFDLSADGQHVEHVAANISWISGFADAVGPQKTLLFDVVDDMPLSTGYAEEARRSGLAVYPWTLSDESHFVNYVWKGDYKGELDFFFNRLFVDAVFTDSTESTVQWISEAYCASSLFSV